MEWLLDEVEYLITQKHRQHTVLIFKSLIQKCIYGTI